MKLSEHFYVSEQFFFPFEDDLSHEWEQNMIFITLGPNLLGCNLQNRSCK